jgi:ATP-dependent DNA helicase PIF1
MDLETKKYQIMSEKLLKKDPLSQEQEKCYESMVKGENIFITGAGGTGKTECILRFAETYKYQKTIGVTSTTGISALLLGGSTLHSYLGIGFGKASVNYLVNKIKERPYLRRRWTSLDILIIDEVSMLSPELFDKIEEIARKVLQNNRPFGGIQLIMSGDFCQLPCVETDNFCFEAKSWNSCIDKTIYLQKIIRQSDKKFQEALNDVRLGLLSKETRKLLTSRLNAPISNIYGVHPTKLYCTNFSVDFINNKELDKLAENDPDFYEYEMKIQPYPNIKNTKYTRNKYIKNCNAPQTLQLCVGCQVMLLYNLDIDAGLVNGSRGVVKYFVGDMPAVKFLNGKEVVIDHHIWEIQENHIPILRMIQVPLRLAYALTAHKSQGCSLDCVEVDLNEVFTYGQAYVMLSRVRNLEGLKILSLDFDKIRASPKALEYYKNLK